ncbi:palmitoyltransferase ZDHHC12-A-like [Haliotis asinina]|uniref:palmitoyltransferase ZDHHC12-A-like n=1 Tax=Haliotis asinina TaxID=109174 RepID=UPI0035319183
MMFCWNCRCGANILVRTIHTALCVGVPVTLLVKDTILSRAVIQTQDLLYGIAYLLLMTLSIVFYYLACFIDPGYLPLKKKKASVNNNSEDEGSDEDSSMLKNGDKDVKYRMCDYCEIQQPMRAKHCEDCKRCVRKYDHHCPWLEACVGERNHKFFLLFLLATAMLVLWTFYIAWNAIVFRLDWSDWFKANFLFFIDIIILIFGGFVVVGLLCFHSYLMVKGMTTWEAASRERITYLKYLDDDYNPFDEGVCKNMYYFLCVCKVRKWESVYSKKADVNGNGGIV